MRFLDLALALLIGSSAFVGIASVTPKEGDASSQRLATQMRLRDTLLTILQRQGMPWLILSSPQEICSTLKNESNASVMVSATMDHVPCSEPPSKGLVEANLTFTLANREVCIEAWSSVPA